jgi:hypothetical protein
LLFQEQFIKTPFNIKINTHILTDAIYQSKTPRVQWDKTYSTIALAKSAMERIPLHSWEMEFSIQYHVTINSQLNDQN